MFRSLVFHCKLLTCPGILTERRGIMYVQKIYGLGKVKLKIRLPDRLDKTKI